MDKLRLDFERQKETHLNQRKVWENNLKSNATLIHRREGQIDELRATLEQQRTQLDERYQQIGGLREALGQVRTQLDKQIETLLSSVAAESAKADAFVPKLLN